MKGYVKAPVIPVRFAQSGKVSWVKVKKGDRVKKGQALAGLDKREQELQHEIELADYERVRADFDKLSREIPKASTDDEKTEKQKAQALLNRAVKMVEKYKYELDQMVMISPVTGLVVEDNNMRAGLYISPASFEIEIADMEAVMMESRVRLKTVREKKIKKDTEVLLSLAGEEIESEVVQVGQIVKKDKVVVRVKIPEEVEFVLGEEGEIELIDD